MNANIFDIKKEEYDCIPLSIDIIPCCGIGRIVHSTNLCAYILTQKSKGRINHTS